MDRGYVGFRKVTIKDTWVRGESPSLEVGSKDTHGMCVHLSTDAFVEFEDAVGKDLFSSTRCLLS